MVEYDPQRMAVRLLAVGFLAIVAALHLVRRDVSPLTRGVSRYASKPTTLAITAAFLMLAVALGLVAWDQQSWWLAAAAASIAGVAATPERREPPRHSVTHTVCGFLFFITAAAGIYASSASSLLPGAATVLFFLSIAGMPILARAPGLLQRLSFASIVIWLLRLSSTRP